MQRLSRLLVVIVTSLAVAVGGAAFLPSPAGAVDVSSRAAGPCSTQDQQVGKTQVRVDQAKKVKKRTTRKLRQARKIDRKRDTVQTQKRLNKAKKAKRKAVKKLRNARARHAEARAAASRCHAANDPTTPQQDQAIDEFLEALQSYGLDPAQLQAIADRIAQALGSGQISPDVLTEILVQVLDALSDAGLPADQVSAVLQQILDALSGGDLPSDPAGLIDLIIDTLQDALAGTPLGELNPILEQVQTVLDDLLGGLLGGLPRS